MGLIERIGSDYAYLTGVLGAVSKVTKVAKSPNRTFPQIARELASTYGDRPPSSPSARRSPIGSSTGAPTSMPAGRWRMASPRATWWR